VTFDIDTCGIGGFSAGKATGESNKFKIQASGG
jgi:hypothetical protein